MATGRSSNSSQEPHTPYEDTAAQTAAFALVSGTPAPTTYLVTVGERGQLVLPAEVRKGCDIHPHEKLLIFRYPCGASALVLVKIDDLPELIQCYSRGINDDVYR